MSFDVIVVGAGNAAMAAALSAAEAGARVVVLEAAPVEHAGGNTRYAAGQLRTTFDGANDLTSLVPELTPDEAARCDFGAYGRADYLEDIGRLIGYRCDPDLAEAIVDNSLATLQWMRTIGARFQLSYRRQSVKVGDRIRFWGGLPIELWGGGAGLVEAYHTAATKRASKSATRQWRIRWCSTAGAQWASRAGGAASRCASPGARSCSPAAASRRTPRSGRATWGRAGTSQRSAAPPSTPAPGWTWRWRPVHVRTGTGRVHMAAAGT